MLIEFGVGFGLGIAAGIQLSKIIWYVDQESVWEKRKRENEMVKEALDKKDKFK